MATVERFVWSKTERGYGWQPCTLQAMCIEQDGKTGYWGVVDPDGSRLCLCVDRRGAERVLRRLHRAEQARYRTTDGLDIAVLRKTKAGWTYQGHSGIREPLCGSGKRFATQEEAEAYLMGREVIQAA